MKLSILALPAAALPTAPDAELLCVLPEPGLTAEAAAARLAGLAGYTVCGTEQTPEPAAPELPAGVVLPDTPDAPVLPQNTLFACRASRFTVEAQGFGGYGTAQDAGFCYAVLTDRESGARVGFCHTRFLPLPDLDGGIARVVSAVQLTDRVRRALRGEPIPFYVLGTFGMESDSAARTLFEANGFAVADVADGVSVLALGAPVPAAKTLPGGTIRLTAELPERPAQDF